MKYIYVYPGELAAVKGEAQIATILGSCVSIVLIDQSAGVAGLNHYLLPRPLDKSAGQLRYGTLAIASLIEKLEALGARRHCLVAKVYGGANVLSGVDIGIKVGEQNIDLALNALADLNIPIVEKNVGGQIGRRIQLDTRDGSVKHVFMKKGTAA